ncbi:MULTISPECIES: carbapenem-hydrolyzing class A beta-lactamase FRI-8 [Enterobacter]|uniref:carbapenem-hydrolyzing class A beta-lactamase FRI-8 n=1 Tax=Enterobacter TaxID=547 RepID=UPI0010CA551B|nr:MULTISPECIES: carbapenem-hydrolyzing class A beta-lactamase FRI-8 [Enterobacter]MCG7803989.1 carbapenem-hydrolyzing class A beta-lactamase FRI-8 [Enterobacter asburiae]UAN18825.1 carbapenem-hydrolyzing class A beta-lactamase FRI-8 [Enterobacter asburiae]UAN24702.1 carbapenem-hydrolyzing class A beta-lactamase FRI-8 [Enterobacter sp. JBIWA003]UAN34146.1 carbapenem-hydrolyzing class A beta-lactamase FRI-8 [Enterobacter sp. JBIWA005]UKU10120.1 blaFRI-8 class A beta-lactamase [Enterobacter asbu
MLKKMRKNAIILSFSLCLPFASSNSFANQERNGLAQIKELETVFGGRIGVYLLNTENGKEFSYRQNERFPLCSSFKVFLAASVLKKTQDKSFSLNDTVEYSGRVMEKHSPVSEKYLETGASVQTLAMAAIQYSDNGASNLLMERYVGGPEGLTAFMRSTGDTEFRLDRWELELNSAIPGDKRDTSTPKAVAMSLKNIAFGSVLDAKNKALLQDWLQGNTTGNARVRAAVPDKWVVGDKTGTCGFYGTANDVAILWPDSNSPAVIAVYTTRTNQNDKHDETIIKNAAKIAINAVYGSYK